MSTQEGDRRQCPLKYNQADIFRFLSRAIVDTAASGCVRLERGMKKVNLTKLAYDIIFENVTTGKIKSGHILEVAPLSRLLSISRTPVSTALEQLANECFLSKNPHGRGYIVGAPEQGVRVGVDENDLWLPKNYENSINDRIGRAKFYPQIEEEITACLPFGRFAINVTKLANHYGISRPNAHTALMRLERLGLVRHEGSRWFAGPLSEDDIREHYEMRWILEPIALCTAYPKVTRQFLEERRGRAIEYRKDADLSIKKLVRLEKDLHCDLITLCSNHQMAEAIRRSQAPILWSNFSFETHKSIEVRVKALDEHVQVFDALLDNDVASAALCLEIHLKNSFHAIAPFLSKRTTGGWTLPPYLMRGD